MILTAKGKKVDYVTLVIPRTGGRPPFVYRRRDEWLGMSVRAAVERARYYPYGADPPIKLNGAQISSKSMRRLQMGDKLTFSTFD